MSDEFERPKKSKLPKGVKNHGDLTILQSIDYYNKELMREAREIMEYRAYVLGKFEVAEKEKNFEVAEWVSKEIDYINKRIDFLTGKMQGIRLILKLAGANVDMVKIDD